MSHQLHTELVVWIVTILTGCATLPPGADYPKAASAALEHPEQTRLGRHVASAAQQHAGNSGFRVIPTGADGFLIRMQMINAAERTLDLQYFVFRGDETGWLLTDAVLRAAERGVRVRVLVDDGETEPRDAQLTVIGAHPGVEVRIFNPFAYRGDIGVFRAIEFMFNASRLDYRMHNKLLVADNAIALLGGRNIGDQYFQIDPESQFADVDMFVAGPITRELSAAFDAYWNSDLAIPSQALMLGKAPQPTLGEHREALREQTRVLKTAGVDYVARVATGEPLAGILADRQPLVWAHAEVVCDSPDKKQAAKNPMLGNLMQQAVSDAANAVQSELLLVTPYLIPGTEGVRMIEKLRQRNVRVRILTNSLESATVLLAQAGYMHYRVPLLENGVELYEIRSMLGNSRGSGQTEALSRYGNYSLHAKLFVFDRQRLFVGSMNFDQRSMHLNTEIGLIIDSPVLARQAAKRFDAMVQPANSYMLALRRNDSVAASTLVWRTQENGKMVEYDKEPARSDWQRFKANSLGILPLDKEL